MLTRLPWLLPLTIGIHNLYSRMWRTLLTMLGIVLGVAVVLAIDITNQSTLSSIRQTLDRAVGKAELLVIPKGDTDTLEQELVDWIQDVQGVQLVAPDVRIYTFLANDSPGSELRLSGRRSPASIFRRANTLQLARSASCTWVKSSSCRRRLIHSLKKSGKSIRLIAKIAAQKLLKT